MRKNPDESKQKGLRTRSSPSAPGTGSREGGGSREKHTGKRVGDPVGCGHLALQQAHTSTETGRVTSGWGPGGEVGSGSGNKTIHFQVQRPHRFLKWMLHRQGEL